MAEAPYRIFGAELSPYSVKVRSYFRYKSIPHEWVPRNASNMDEFRRYAKLPLIPLVLAPDGAALQDSTPILERMEAAFPEPSIHPPEPVAAFVSALLEEYADEWGNKAMFHYRWTYEPDQASAAERLARENLPGADEDTVRRTADAVRGRMVPRLSFVGSSAETRGVIEGSFEREVALLEAHLARRPYLFGARPAFADFGVFAQLYECLTDPTPGAYLRAKVPRTVAWIERMLAPKVEGPFEPWTALEPTLLPLLRDEVGGKATNCTNSQTPQDIYQQVADRVTARLEASSEPFAKQWRGFLIGGRVPRSACKRPVMTLPYGSTRYSAHQYVMDWYLEYRKEKKEIPWPVDFYTPCHWLSRQIWESIDEVVIAARAGMKWLQAVARLCHDEGRALEWTAPSGFVVRQAYNDYRRSVVTTHYGAVCSKVKIRETRKDTLSRRQQANGIAPNFVHSLDAAALVRTVNLCAERGIDSFMMIHDSFGCLASDAPLMAQMTRRAYTEIFQEPVFERFRDEQQKRLKAELPSLPPMGSLDVGELMSSKYFFA